MQVQKDLPDESSGFLHRGKVPSPGSRVRLLLNEIEPGSPFFAVGDDRKRACPRIATVRLQRPRQVRSPVIGTFNHPSRRLTSISHRTYSKKPSFVA